MRGSECLDPVRILLGAEQGRKSVERDVEPPRIVQLRHQAHVGAGRGIAEQELARLRRGQRLERGQPLGDPVRIPAVGLLLRVAELVLQIFDDPEIIERVDVARDHHRHRHDMGALGGGRGDERRNGIPNVEIVDDREALRQPVTVDFQHRHEPLRVERAIRVGFLLTLEQVHLAPRIVNALQVQRDPHSVGGGRTIIIMEDDPAHPRVLTLARRTALSLPAEPASAGRTPYRSSPSPSATGRRACRRDPRTR